MSQNKDLDLLIDILKLLRKYGQSSFESLLSKLESQELFEQINPVLKRSSLLQQYYKSGGVGRSDKKIDTEDYRKSLIEISNNEPEKSKILVQLYDDLNNKMILPSLRNVKNVIFDMGEATHNCKSRNQAFLYLLKILSEMKIDELNLWVSKIYEKDPNYDRSLEGWSDIILNPSRRNKKNI